MWKTEHIFVNNLKEKLKLAPYCCFLKTDGSEDNRLDKETDQLLPLHMPWCHSSVENKCIKVKVDLSNYNDDKLSQGVVFMAPATAV